MTRFIMWSRGEGGYPFSLILYILPHLFFIHYILTWFSYPYSLYFDPFIPYSLYFPQLFLIFYIFLFLIFTSYLLIHIQLAYFILFHSNSFHYIFLVNFISTTSDDPQLFWQILTPIPLLMTPLPEGVAAKKWKSHLSLQNFPGPPPPLWSEN